MDHIQIVAASNNLYVPYLSVMLHSVMNYSSKSRSYAVTILHTDITAQNQDVLTNMLRQGGFDIKFIDVTKKMYKYSNLFISNHIKIETYFRLLLPDMLSDINKVLYIDCDVIANSDVAQLYDLDISRYYLAGTRDADSAANYNSDADYRNYIDKVLKLKKPYEYLQAGIILMNLKKFREQCGTKKLLDVALSRKWRFHDQDTLNYLCHGNILFVDYSWNFVYDYNQYLRRSTEIISKAPAYIFKDYMVAKENPKMIHFSWIDKPWFSPGVHFGEKFWMIARETPYYAEMLVRTEESLANYIMRR